MRVIDRTGHFLAIAGDEWHRRDIVTQPNDIWAAAQSKLLPTMQTAPTTNSAGLENRPVNLFSDLMRHHTSAPPASTPCLAHNDAGRARVVRSEVRLQAGTLRLQFGILERSTAAPRRIT